MRKPKKQPKRKPAAKRKPITRKKPAAKKKRVVAPAAIQIEFLVSTRYITGGKRGRTRTADFLVVERPSAADSAIIKHVNDYCRREGRSDLMNYDEYDFNEGRETNRKIGTVELRDVTWGR